MADYDDAVCEVQRDDDEMRVALWWFEPGTQTEPHTHEYDYIVVPVADGRLIARSEDGEEMKVRLKPGKTYSRKAGLTHNVVNDSDSGVGFVEIELKKGFAKTHQTKV
ncbi:cupin domain-containing protein [Actinomycetota bacterium]